MTSKEILPEDDGALDAFLRKEDSLASLLQSLDQPQPSAELDAAIMADAEAALTQCAAPQTSANDPVFPGAAQRPRLPFLSRWKIPLSLAATALLTLSVVWTQRSGEAPSDAPIQVAQAPVSTAAPRAAASAESTSPDAVDSNAPADRAAAPATTPKTSRHASPAASQSKSLLAKRRDNDPVSPAAPMAEAAPSVLAKAEIPDETRTVWRGGPPQPKDWLRRIEEKIDAGARQEAQDEWTKFRKAYPNYEVPNRLLEKIEALKK